MQSIFNVGYVGSVGQDVWRLIPLAPALAPTPVTSVSSISPYFMIGLVKKHFHDEISCPAGQKLGCTR
jgi:hypothetical protein